MQGQGVEAVPRPTGCQSSGPVRDGKGATSSHKKSDVGGDGFTYSPSVQGEPPCEWGGWAGGWEAHRVAGFQALTFMPGSQGHLLTGAVRTDHALSICLAVKQK